ncbi:filamentous hemagglutinin N-terminal domain-containing protein, partial [Erwinia sp. CPCC 100877]|nr:filamentous hemagglutinin N-terminal domain-containing protein [Erwinia sp. CPCC 100877]
MNRLLYRIVFNRARGMLMVVAEIARSCTGSGTPSGIGHTHSRLIGKVSAISLSLWLATGAIQTVQANIVADKSAPGNQRPTVIATANGIPQVNIQTPSAAGVSRNTYSQFDVNQKGAILNNSHKNTATQIGGMVAANPWLAKGEAKIILNEVNSRDPSHLNGYIEVAGQKAQVVIANPSGITCNGCGFINADRATLTTGRAQMQNGRITGYQVDRGEILVEGKGLDTSRQDHTDIIARAVKANAAIYANDLKVTAGRNQVDAAHEQIAALADDGSAKPQLAVDVSQLGGMYAGKIRLLGTEKGVGVRNAGHIGSEAGLVAVTADGRIENSGTLLSSGDAVVQTQADVHNSGSMAARNNVTVSGAQIVSTSAGTLAAGVQSDGKVGDSGNLTLTASGKLEMNGLNVAGSAIRASGQGLDASGSQTQAKNITLDAGHRDLSTAGAQVIADNTLKAATDGTLDNNSGQLAADKLSLTAKRLQNNKGQIVQSGEESLTLNHQEGIENREGTIATNARDLTLRANSLDNRDGEIIHAGEGSLTIDADAFTGDRGSVTSSGTLALKGKELVLDGTTTTAKRIHIEADNLSSRDAQIVQSGQDTMTLDIHQNTDNRGGLIAANGDLQLNTTRLDNQKGQLAAQGNLTLAGKQLDNDNGGLVQSGGDLTLTVDDIRNRDSGESGGITSQGNMAITAASLLNDRGVLLSRKQATLDTTRFSNISGTLETLEALKLTTRSDTDNHQGVIQGGGIVLDTGAHLLDNQDGTIYSLAAMQLATAGLNNQNGTFGAKGDFTLNGSWLDNSHGGRLVGENATTLTLASLDNRDGQIQSVGSLIVNALSGVIDNTQGLIRSGASATLNADSLINRDTQVAEKGIEGGSVAIDSRELDNRSGSLLAEDRLGITRAETLDNTQGELATNGELSVDGASLNLINTAGVVKAGQQLTIQAERLGGDGQLLSLGDMVLNSRQDITNSGEMTANGNFTFTTPGQITNSGKLLSGATLDLTSGNLLNTATGEIAAGHTWLTVTNTLTNYGLIDGNRTLLKAGTLTNMGTGRIYGDDVGIQAGTLNNLASDGAAATIAGRERVDIGAGTINNRDHALIYSAGDMAIGGRLDASGMATGQAGVIDNHSATIESGGKMSLSVGTLNNINDHFSTEVVPVSSEQIHEYRQAGSSNRWDADAEGVFVDNNSSDHLLNLNTPEYTGPNNDDFYEYDYTRTTEEEVIGESDPGKILSGGDMSVSAGQVLNDKSQIVAGGTLGMQADTVNNVMPEGSRWITDTGWVTHYYRHRLDGHDAQRSPKTEYAPPVVIQSITLHPGSMTGNGTVNGSGIQLAAATQQGTNVTIGDTGSVSVDVEHQTVPGVPVQSEVPVIGNPALVVRVSGPNTRLPDNSLFKTHPEPEANYLVETDPRFTNNKQWLGSDYMQEAFAANHDNMHKRLGDGYYEQQLVREQIINLTGGRYLGDYSDDETQFKALMDAGIAFGQKYQLTPGVALTAEQMSLLTGDMVWLVNTQVQLADGTWQTVMVPQVYVRVKPGDIDGSGALLGGRNVVMNLNGNLVNSGTLGGREVVQLSAENITSQAGIIQGADVDLLARTDINNIGGLISGNHSVRVNAGRDINVVTTTRSAESTSGASHFERTTLERTGSIYVQGDDGELSLSAGRDITLTGSQVVNEGENSRTALSAGRDVNLNAVSTSASDALVWDKNNWLKESTVRQVGSEVSGAGTVQIVTGRDVNAQAADVSAGGRLDVAAGRDINLTAATDSNEFESRHKYSGRSGGFSKTTTTTHDHVYGETAQGTLFSGDSVSLRANNDLLVQGSQVVGDNDVSLKAGNTLTITTAEERDSESHQKQEKKSGLSGTGGIGVTYGSQRLKVTDTEQGVTHQGSTVGSVNGDVTLSAGNALNVRGSELVAGRDMTLSGRDVSVTSETDSRQQTHKVEQESSGLTLGLSGTVGSALNTATEQARSVKKEDDSRLAALKGTQAALTGYQAVQAGRLAAVSDDKAKGNTVGLTLSYGHQKSTSESRLEQQTSSGSALTAGRDMTILARGDDSGQGGDLTIQGSKLTAGRDMAL